MLRVTPVYNLSLCVSKSTHAGALPGPAYPYVDYHRSVEIHPVSWIPGPWCSETKGVFSDSHKLMLNGHDTGMMIPHMSPIMDNLLLPLTMITSSCTWPFASLTKCAGKDKKSVLGFFPVLAPFVYCDDSESAGDKGGSGDGGKGGGAKPSVKKVNSDKLQKEQKGHPLLHQMATPQRPISDAMNPLVIRSSGAKAVREKLQQFSDKIGIRVSGKGRVCIPTSCTVILRFGFADFAMGWATVLVSKVFDAVVGAMLKPLKSNPRNALKRLDDDLAVRAASSWAARRDGYKTLLRPLAEETVWKTAYDGVLKSMILDGKVKAPYGLFSFSLAGTKGEDGANKGKGSFLWWGSFEGPVNPITFKGIRGLTKDAIADCYQPGVEDITKDNPNYAAAPGEHE